MSEDFTIALAGNPNCGKSTIFNALTGSHQHVGNWPGKTVEQKSGVCRYKDFSIEVVDLPGTYSLAAYSQEEIIARDYLIEDAPDVVVAVVDAANLERNLYLAVQILELGAKLILALNMSDIADSRGLKIDRERLSAGLGGVPVIRTIASKGDGVNALLDAAIALTGAKPGKVRAVA